MHFKMDTKLKNEKF